MNSRLLKCGLFCLLQIAVAANSHGAIITQWTFETSPPADLSNSATIGGIGADSGTGIASGVHASAATDWTTPVGNGSANSLSSNTWAVGDYYQFSTATTGFENIMLGWGQTSSATGPRDFRLSYRVGGIGAFTSFADYTVLENLAAPGGNGTWVSGTERTAYNLSFDLSAIAALENAATVDFRLVDRSTVSASGGVVGTAGTSRVDNFTIQGSTIAVPEPRSIGFLGLIAGIGLIRARVRRMRYSIA